MFNRISWRKASEYRSILMGVYALLIFFFHFCLDGKGFEHFPIILRIYGRWGNCISDAFLILSGISSYYSLTNNNDIKRFYQKRFTNIYSSYLFYVFPLTFLSCLYSANNLFLIAIRDMSLFGTIAAYNRQYWFCIAIVICYIIVPFIYSLKKTKLIGLIITLYALNMLIEFLFPQVYSVIEIVTTRIGIFVVGVFLGQKCKNDDSIRDWKIIFIGLIIVVVDLIQRYELVSVVNNTLNRIQMGFTGFLVIAISILVIDFAHKYIHSNNSLIAKLGGVSLDIYLSHITFRYIVNHSSAPTSVKTLIYNYTIIFIVSCTYICFRIFLRNRYQIGIKS